MENTNLILSDGVSYVFRDKTTNAALDLANASPNDDTPVVSLPTHGKANQAWTCVKGVDGYWLINIATGTYLTAKVEAEKTVLRANSKNPMEWNISQVDSEYELRLTSAANQLSPAVISVQPGEAWELSGPNHNGTITRWVLQNPQALAKPSLESFATSPEHAKIVNHVKNTIHAINKIIDILDHPKSQKDGDAIELNYTDEAVKMFIARSVECKKNLDLSKDTAASWANAIEARLIEILVEKKALEDQQKSLEEKKAITEASLTGLQTKLDEQNVLVAKQEKVFTDSETSYNTAHAKHKKAVETQKKLEEPTLTNALRIGFASRGGDIAQSMVLHIASAEVKSTKLKMDADKVELDKNRRLRDEISGQCQQTRVELDKATHSLEDIGKKNVEVSANVLKLQAEGPELSKLSVALERCTHAVSGAVTKAGSIPRMMSFVNASVNVKELVECLKTESDFTGPLASLDAANLAKLNVRLEVIGPSA